MNNKNDIGISILMPLYNGIEFLEESLKSIIEQTYNKWEVIIGINGWEPDSEIEKKTIEIVNNIHNNNLYNDTYDINVIFYYIHGKPQTLNKMILDSKYDYIALLDVDDVWLPTKLEEQIKYINDYDVIGTNCQYFGERNDSPVIPFGNFTNEHNFFISNPIINSSVLLKKQDAYWDENELLEDYDLWFKLYHNKKKFYNIDKVLCKHRISKSSSFNNINYKVVDKLRVKWLRTIFSVDMNDVDLDTS